MRRRKDPNRFRSRPDSGQKQDREYILRRLGLRTHRPADSVILGRGPRRSKLFLTHEADTRPAQDYRLARSTRRKLKRIGG